MLVDTCSSRSGNQYSTALVGWDIQFNMTISSFSSSCISFLVVIVVVIVVVTVFISFMYTDKEAGREEQSSPTFDLQ